MQDIRRIINERAQTQRGLLTRADLRALGVSADRRHRLVREGTLVQLGCRTFGLAGWPTDHRRRILAACLDTGGVASHMTATWLQGVPNFDPRGLPEVVVGRKTLSARSSLAIVHTTTSLPATDIDNVDGIPVTSMARTLLLLAGMPGIDHERVRGAVDDAVRMAKASDKWLWHRLEKLRVRGRPGISVLEAILTARAGGEITESWLEREFLRVLREAGLVLPVCQARIAPKGPFVARVDFLYADLGIVIEVTGAVGHSTPAQRAADARRRNRLGRLGLLVLEFTYEQVVGDPAAVVREVLDARVARNALIFGNRQTRSA
jgi:hypothetical protein